MKPTGQNEILHSARLVSFLWLFIRLIGMKSLATDGN
jgi:hypothetical protein